MAEIAGLAWSEYGRCQIMKPLLNTSVPFFSRRSMAAAAIEKNIYFFGGVGAGGTESILDVSADLWSFDTGVLTWQAIVQKSLWPSSRRCVGWSAYKKELLLWGGSGIAIEANGASRYNFLNDFWRFNRQSSTWELLRESEDHRITPNINDGVFPFPRYTPVFQAVGDELFLFGGYTEDRLGKRKLNDAWICSDGKWQQVPFSGRQGYLCDVAWPGLRYGCMSAADSRNVYICGGFSDEGDHIDLWKFDMTDRRWDLLSPDMTTQDLPSPRYCSAFALHGRRLYLFGGRSRQHPKLNFNDLWFFDLDARKWSMISGSRTPHEYDAAADFPGYHAKSSSAVVEDCWYILGGEGLHGHVSDFWRFDFVQQTWQLIQAARGDDPKFW